MALNSSSFEVCTRRAKVEISRRKRRVGTDSEDARVTNEMGSSLSVSKDVLVF